MGPWNSAHNISSRLQLTSPWHAGGTPWFGLGDPGSSTTLALKLGAGTQFVQNFVFSPFQAGTVLSNEHRLGLCQGQVASNTTPSIWEHQNIPISGTLSFWNTRKYYGMPRIHQVMVTSSYRPHRCHSAVMMVVSFAWRLLWLICFQLCYHPSLWLPHNTYGCLTPIMVGPSPLMVAPPSPEWLHPSSWLLHPSTWLPHPSLWLLPPYYGCPTPRYGCSTPHCGCCWIFPWPNGVP